MFDFFEGMISKLRCKLISDFSEKLINWIKETIKNNTSKKAEGDCNNIGAEGDYNNIGAEGDCNNIGAEGDCNNIGAEGDCNNIGAEGDYNNIGAEGNYNKIGAEGNYNKIGAEGNYNKIGAEGDYNKIGAEGNYNKIGAEGNGNNIVIKGKYNIGFIVGYGGIIKASKGTWISLAEFERNKEGKIIPIFAKSAQIGNKEYKDHSGKTLKENTYYILWRKEFYPVDNYDGIWTIKISEKKRDNIKIIKAIDKDTILYKKPKEIYIAKEGKLSAHGYTVREAVEDLTYKKLDKIYTKEIVEKIKETGKVTRSQYRAITGACSFGTNKFCEEHNIQDLEEIELDELRKILINNYGAEKFWSLIDGNKNEQISTTYRNM